MKVHFIGSSNHLEEYKNAYIEIIDQIKKQGHEVVTLYDPIGYSLDEVISWDREKMRTLRSKWRRILDNIDVVVVESSFPSSINVGAAIAAAVAYGKPVVSIYRFDREPVILNEYYSNRLIKIDYHSVSEISQVIGDGLDEAIKLINRRFTMNIPGRLDSYLDRIVKAKRISRSEFIRELIEREMKRNAA